MKSFYINHLKTIIYLLTSITKSISMASFQLTQSIPQLFEGGDDIISVKTVKIANNPNTYKIAKYDKSKLLDDDIINYGLVRSVVLSDDNNIISFSPPKCLPIIDDICSEFDHCRIEEKVEGTMINLFYYNGLWEIATKSIIGAKRNFYRNSPNFRIIFFDLIASCGVDLDSLPRNYSYSFVIQHPLNRIIVPVLSPALYLIAVYRFDTSVGKNQTVIIVNRDHCFEDHFKNTTVALPKQYENMPFPDLLQKYASDSTPYTTLGCIIYEKNTGRAYKICNPLHSKVKLLRGNQSNLLYLYLSLRLNGDLKQYLLYFPEHSDEFSTYRNNIFKFTQTLFDTYRSCFIKHADVLANAPDKLRPHLYALHQHYHNVLKKQNKYVNKYEVIQYVNTLCPELLIVSL